MAQVTWSLDTGSTPGKAFFLEWLLRAAVLTSVGSQNIGQRLSSLAQKATKEQEAACFCLEHGQAASRVASNSVSPPFLPQETDNEGKERSDWITLKRKKKGLSNESATSSKGAPWKSKTPEEVNSESVAV